MQFLLDTGGMIQDLVDGQTNFDVLSFDPRGVGFSTNSHCIGDFLSDQVWELKQRVIGNLEASAEAIKTRFASFQGRAALRVTRTYNSSDDISEHT